MRGERIVFIQQEDTHTCCEVLLHDDLPACMFPSPPFLPPSLSPLLYSSLSYVFFKGISCKRTLKDPQLRYPLSPLFLTCGYHRVVILYLQVLFSPLLSSSTLCPLYSLFSSSSSFLFLIFNKTGCPLTRRSSTQLHRPLHRFHSRHNL